MIIVNLKGGTGNQLFQYALGRHLAIKNKAELKFDVYGLERANAVGDIHRDYALGAYNVEAEIATPEEIKKLKYPLGILSKGWRFIRFKISRDKNKYYRPTVLNWNGDMYLDGYWQSPLYFDSIRDTLLEELTLKEELSGDAAKLKTQIENTESVSLHVRRGDYVKNPQVLKEFGLCSKTYYQNAIAEIKKRVSNPTFFVFSDDITWVRENLDLGDKVVYIQGNGLTDIVELSLMNTCKHNIIANSSFSWWAAWLNQNPEKVVIAPTPWFDNGEYDTNLIPKSWIELPK